MRNNDNIMEQHKKTKNKVVCFYCSKEIIGEYFNTIVIEEGKTELHIHQKPCMKEHYIAIYNKIKELFGEKK